MKTISCLDKGYVGLVDHTGDHFTFEVRAPLMVVNDLIDSTRCYVAGDIDFYVPDYHGWRIAAENGSQSDVPVGVGSCFSLLLEEHVARSQELYRRAINKGVSRDQAKLFLPAYSLYVLYHWDTTLQRVLFLLDQCFRDKSQSEKYEYANAVRALTEPFFPDTFIEVFGDHYA